MGVVGSAGSAAEWFRRGRRNLRAARAMLDLGMADMAAFHAQQAAEFVLKAVQIHRNGRFSRTHDLPSLAAKVSAPPRIMKLASLLTPAYVSARYPDSVGPKITKRRGETYLQAARRIVRWARRQLL